MNLVILSGFLGKDAELKFLPNGNAVLSFSLAVNTGYGEKKHTLWYSCSLFGERGEKIASHFTKGTPVEITGELRGDPATGNPRIWTRNDGTPGSSFEVTVKDFGFAPGKREASRGEQTDDEQVPF
jgi:single-strand DNA-binding protein